MNEISIIINGVRYDAATPRYDVSCNECDLADFCQKAEMHSYTCLALIGVYRCFKKSDKKFEK